MENKEPGRFLGRELTIQQPNLGGKLAGYWAGLDQCGCEERGLGLEHEQWIVEDGWSNSTYHQVMVDKGGPSCINDKVRLSGK